MKEYILIALCLCGIMACSNGQSKKQEQEKVELEGVFKSKMGVMHNISCYCYKVGFLETAENKKIATCFEKMDIEEVPECKKLKVTGWFEEKEIKNESNSPCSEGSREIFYVESFECIDE